MLLLCYRSPHSGTVGSDTPGMLHADQSLHDDANTGDEDGLTSAAASTNVEVSSSTAANTESDAPSVASQSAVYEKPGEDGRPVYRGFQDPKSQSLTFKKLQSVIESGEGKRITTESRFYATISEVILTCIMKNVQYNKDICDLY